MKRPRGLSLLEAIISIFILFSAFLVIINLFQSGLRYSSRIENQQVAAMLAGRKLEEVRAWSQTPTSNGYNFDNWTAYNGVTSTPSDFPNYRIRTDVTSQSLYSSCSLLELPYPSARRVLDSSCQLLKVTVSWSSGNQLVVSSLVGDPPRQFNATNAINITVGSATLPLPHDATVGLTAQAYDNYGNLLPDVKFLWDVSGSLCSGTLVQNRDGSAANFTNNVILPDGLTYYSGPGPVVVQARASLHGQVRVGQSAQISIL